MLRFTVGKPYEMQKGPKGTREDKMAERLSGTRKDVESYRTLFVTGRVYLRVTKGIS